MRLDAHQHFWRYDAAEYAWMTEAMGPLRRVFLPEHLAAEQAKLGFDGSIAVQARQSVTETRWLLGLAAAHPRIRGVVGYLDLRADDLESQLELFADDKHLRGLRHVVQDEPDDRFMLGEAFLRGMGKLRAWGLTYDILIYPRHLPCAIELVRRFREQPFVLDHCAKPFIAAGKIEPWATDLRMLAESPNVCCKLSGLVTEADWHNWRPADLRPYLDVAMEAFGPERLMIGSDWPPCTLAGRYDQVLHVVMDYIRDLSADEQAGILGRNAAKFYGITTA